MSQKGLSIFVSRVLITEDILFLRLVLFLNASGFSFFIRKIGDEATKGRLWFSYQSKTRRNE